MAYNHYDEEEEDEEDKELTDADFDLMRKDFEATAAAMGGKGELFLLSRRHGCSSGCTGVRGIAVLCHVAVFSAGI